MATTEFERTTFETPRASEYFTTTGLSKQTGRGMYYFPEVVIKELADNALDACEAHKVPPEISVKVEKHSITVTDNGPGLPTETVKKILDFNTRTSDKAAYRSPTRGAQGNALKTVLGMPHALGLEEPVVIESQGVRHLIRCWLDPAGELRKDHKLHSSSRTRGTRVTVPLSTDILDELTPGQLWHWVGSFALLNPHADVKIEESEGWSEHAQTYPITSGEIYNALTSEQKKYRPKDPTSAHWYSVEDFERLIHSYIGHARRGGEDMHLGKFVRMFQNLKGTQRAKEVCSHFPEISRLSDFQDRKNSKHEIKFLLDRMKWHSKAPKATTLGTVGKVTIERRLEEMWGEIDDFAYKRLEWEIKPGLPLVFEFAIAELSEDVFSIGRRGGFYYGINYSPTFDDPLGDLRITSSALSGRGVGGFLEGCYAHPTQQSYEDPAPPETVVLAHVITPAPVFLDAGKTRISVPSYRREDLADCLGKAMYSVLKPYHTAGKKRIKDKKAAAKRKPKTKKVSLIDACFMVIPEAVEHVSGRSVGKDLRYAARRLLYRVRKMIQQYTSAELTEGYFRDNILQKYQEKHGKLEGIYYEARGRLHEPHEGGRNIDVGTREVEEYTFPAHRYNKLLYVEKRGQFPLLQDAEIMERFDMAIMTGQGVATTAARTLLANAEAGQDIQLFVLHDADPYGYNIAHTLREETERMPGHNVEVIDLALSVEQGLELGIEPEDFVRKEALYQRVRNHLDPDSPAWEMFGADLEVADKKNVPCKRIELDALTSPQAVELIEKGLAAEGVHGKIVPGPDELPDLAEQIYRAEANKWADRALEELLGWEALKRELADEFMAHFKLENSDRYIRARHKQDDAFWWKDGLKDVLGAIQEAKHEESLKEAVREKITTTLTTTDDTDGEEK